MTDGIIDIPLHPTVSRKEEQNDLSATPTAPTPAKSKSDSKRNAGKKRKLGGVGVVLEKVSREKERKLRLW